MSRFEVEESDTYLCVTCTGELQAPDLEEFNSASKVWIGKARKGIIFDTNQIHAVPQWFVRGLTQLQQNLKKTDSPLYLVNLSKDAMKQIEHAGLKDLLKVKGTQKEALIAMGVIAHDPEPQVSQAAYPPLESYWVQLASKACHQAFDGPLGGHARISAPQPETAANAFESEIYATVPFHLPKRSGGLWLAFPQAALMSVYQCFTGEKAAKFGPEVAAGGKELADLLLQQIQVICQAESDPIPTRSGHTLLAQGFLPRLTESKAAGAFIDVQMPEGTFRVVLRLSR
jgi:hypothetical protein